MTSRSSRTGHTREPSALSPVLTDHPRCLDTHRAAERRSAEQAIDETAAVTPGLKCALEHCASHATRGNRISMTPASRSPAPFCDPTPDSPGLIASVATPWPGRP